jgi:IMP dehydrogenase/GMP reductase
MQHEVFGVKRAKSLRKAASMATLSTRFTRALNLRHPIVSAPMAFAGGGALAAAVSKAGGLGLIGGGYGDPTWLDEQFVAAGEQEVGVGFHHLVVEQAAVAPDRRVEASTGGGDALLW